MLSLPDGKQHSALGGAPSSNHLSALGAIAQHHKSWHQWQLLLCHTAPCHRCPRLLPLCPWSTCVSAEMQGSLSCSIPSPGAAMVQERHCQGWPRAATSSGTHSQHLLPKHSLIIQSLKELHSHWLLWPHHLPVLTCSSAAFPSSVSDTNSTDR